MRQQQGLGRTLDRRRRIDAASAAAAVLAGVCSKLLYPLRDSATVYENPMLTLITFFLVCTRRICVRTSVQWVRLLD